MSTLYFDICELIQGEFSEERLRKDLKDCFEFYNFDISTGIIEYNNAISEFRDLKRRVIINLNETITLKRYKISKSLIGELGSFALIIYVLVGKIRYKHEEMGI